MTVTYTIASSTNLLIWSGGSSPLFYLRKLFECAIVRDSRVLSPARGEYLVTDMVARHTKELRTDGVKRVEGGVNSRINRK